MVKKLALLRHGEAESLYRQPDFDRNLTSAGQAQLATLADQINHIGYQPDKILCSPSKRTMQTAKIFIKRLDCQFEPEWIEDIYEATVRVLFNLIAHTADSVNSLLLIGHNPGLSYLVDYLTNQSGHNLSPGEMIQLEFEDLDSWVELSQGMATISAKWK